MLDKLSYGIPLAEASDFFIRLRSFEKKADANNIGSSTYEAPDETGELEGQYAMSVEQVLAHMAKMVQNELKTQYAYMVFSNSLRDMAHHSIADEFEQHAHDETEHADFLLRRMSVMGGPVSVPDIPAPPAATDPEAIVRIMIRMEQEGIQNWRTLRQMIGDENPMKFKVEEYLTKEQEHLDELWQVLPREAHPQILAAKAGQPMSSTEVPQTPPSAPDTNPTPRDQQNQDQRAKTADARDVIDSKRISRGDIGTHLILDPTAMRLGALSGELAGHPVAGRALGLAGGAYLSSKINDRNAEQNARILSNKRMTAEDKRLLDDGGNRLLLSGALNGFSNHMAGGNPYLSYGAGVGGGLLLRERSQALRDAHERHHGKKKESAAGKEKAADMPPMPETAMGKQQSAPTPTPLQGPAAGQHMMGKMGGKYAAAFKLALDGLGMAPAQEQIPGATEGQDPSAAGAVPQPEMDPEAQAYLQQEQQGMAAEHEGEQAFYKQKFEAASQALQAAQQASQSAQQQSQQLQQQVDEGAHQQQQALAQAQQLEQAAMQNATAAHAAATQAMQQSLQAQKDSMTQAQLAVGMRDSVHAMRSSLMQMIQQELPPATPAEAGAIQGDMMAQQQGLQPGAADPNAQQGAPGQDNTQQPAPDGTGPGQPAAAPDAGTPPASPTPGGGANPNAADGNASAPVAAGATPTAQQGQAQEPPKTASAKDRFIGAITGGAVGGLGAAAESQMSNDPLRQKVKSLAAKESEGGGFMNAMNLAQAKMRLAMGEFSEKHPVANTAIGTAVGAATGAGLGPKVRHAFGG